jgi:hypothetical protein
VKISVLPENSKVSKRSANRFNTPILIGTMLLITLLASSANGLFIESYVQDFRFVLNAMYAAAHHLQIHRDEVGPVGQIYYWAYIPFTIDNNYSTADLTHANLLIAWIAALTSIVLLRGVASYPVVFAVTLISFLVACSPRENNTLSMISQLAPYNRWGWAFLTPLAAFAVLPQSEEKSKPSRVLTLGFILFVLFFLKVTYFAGAGILLAGGACLGLIKFRQMVFAGLVFLVGALILQIANHSVTAYLNDIVGTLKANAMPEAVNARKWRLLGSGFEGFRYGIAYILVLWLVNPAFSSSIADWFSWIRRHMLAIAAGVLITLGALLVMFQNHAHHESAVLSISLLCAWAWAEKLNGPINLKRRLAMVGLALASIVSLSTPILDIASLARQNFMTRGQSAIVAGFANTPMRDFYVPSIHGRTVLTNQDIFSVPDPVKVNSEHDKIYYEVGRTLDAVDYLRGKVTAKDVVLSAYHSNEFPAMLGLSAPKVQMQWWDYGRSFSEAYHLPAEQIFGGVTIFLEPKTPPSYAFDSLGYSPKKVWSIYGGYITAHYRLVGETRFWRIWRRVDSEKVG